VLIMTGYLRAVDLASARASGVTQFLTKPFTLASMAEALQQALGKNGGTAGT
jgi:CheY-like chemotaxis protein